MRADPVHLGFHGDRLIMADSSRLAVTPEESLEFVTALNAHFAGEGISFLAPHPQRWYLRTTPGIPPRTTPTSEAAGQNVEALLPQGDDGARWRRVINEAQMLLHEHSRNEAREQRGQPTVNSIWIWGAGRDCRLSPAFDALWSDHPLAVGLAAASGGTARPLPASGASFLEAQHSGAHLVVLTLPPTVSGDLAEWRGAVATVERSWFSALLAGLWDGALESLTLHGLGPHYGYTSVLTRQDRLHFWRTRRPLHAYAP
jgi:hypothetical protein